MRKYGVVYPCLTDSCRNANFNVNSHINEDFAFLLDLNDIEYKQEFALGKYAYDFLVRGKMLIEINPTYTHSTVGNHFSDFKPTPEYQTYHKEKTEFAKAQGYYCINIWDWDDWDKIIMLIDGNREKLYARNLEIKEVNKNDANRFLNTFHIQSKCNGNIVNLGLFLMVNLSK